MNLEEIKEIIQKEGGKIVIVEEGKPQMVVMSYEDWRGKPKKAEQTAVPAAALEQNFAVHEPAPRPPASPPPSTRPISVDPESLTIDDLPL
jgi:prevent-host-death family protein